MIKIFELNKAYGDQVLFEDLTLNINRGEKIGLVGRNGHGKSTLFQMILGEIEPDSGSITVPRNYRVGYLEQHLHFSKPTALEEACLGLSVKEEYDTWKVEKILSGLGFSEEDMSKSPAEFSGGYQIRLNLAKLLASNPDMLMLDEPKQLPRYSRHPLARRVPEGLERRIHTHYPRQGLHGQRDNPYRRDPPLQSKEN